MLNKEGIEQLKINLMANAHHYNQEKFAVVTPQCGTEMCMAGMCYFMKVGEKQFQKESDPYSPSFDSFVDSCLSTAIEQLGMKTLAEDEYDELMSDRDSEYIEGLPLIFAPAEWWPEDLAERYRVARNAHDHVAMAKVACDALDRTDENGMIALELVAA